MYFVFLEFLDPRVENTLRDLRDSLQPWKRSGSPVHVTVRGPYKTEPDSKKLSERSKDFAGQGVRINGVGYFSHRGTYSVFLRAESSIFKDIWWKPDFPTKEYEMQPHITLFESTDITSALQVHNFLKAARISIRTTSVQLSVFKSGQADLFGIRPIAKTPSNFMFGKDIVVVDEELLSRAEELGVHLNSRRNQLIGLAQGMPIS